MMFAILPLVPLLLWGSSGVAALASGGYYLWTQHERRPPYKTAEVAYQHYVQAVEKEDYEMYQWCVISPMPEEEFKNEGAIRKQKKLAPIKEGVGRQYFANNETKWWFDALSPWSRRQRRFIFLKVGDSFKLDGDNVE